MRIFKEGFGNDERFLEIQALISAQWKEIGFEKALELLFSLNIDEIQPVKEMLQIFESILGKQDTKEENIISKREQKLKP